jgi:multicomponent Na+:H+ antiporter subunit E
MLLWNLMLALTWAVATGLFTLANFVVGFLLGFLVLVAGRRVMGPSHYYRKVPQVAAFAAFYLKEMLLANLRVAYDVVTPTHYMRPGVLAIPLDAKSDAEITLLANLLTLTPGSLSVDLTPDRSVLYLHVMYIDEDDVEAVRRKVKDSFERRVLEVLS